MAKSTKKLPAFNDVLRQAQREGAAIVTVVRMADKSVRAVAFGARGGWRFVK